MMIITIQQCLSEATQQLANISDNPMLDAQVLLAHTLQQSRTYLHARPEHQLTLEEIHQFNAYLQRRCNREPIAYITGKREFWSLEFLVTRDTLIPRPETELLVETILKRTDHHKVLKIADLGTGCGAIALALAHECPHWQIYATDRSEDALAIARKNAQRFGLENLAFFQGNWCTALPCSDLDVIVSNPPYIAESEWERYADNLVFEPRHALVAGATGLNAIHEIISSAKLFLRPAGFLIIEHGFSQGQAIRSFFEKMGYKGVETIKDLAGKERATLGVA